MNISHSLVFGLLFLFFLQDHKLSATETHEPNLKQLWHHGHREAYLPGSGFHTSIRPYFYNELRQVANLDSLYSVETLRVPQKGLLGWTLDRLLNRSAFMVNEPDFTLSVDPLFDFSFGRETASGNPTWTNTRGILFEGTVGSNIGFSTRFYENQGRFPGWINDFVRQYRVLPGQGFTRTFKETAYDYNRAEGYVSYSPSKHFNFQLGHGKHFIGDGYRSLLLSDNAFPYPYLKGSLNVWRLKYIILYTELQNLAPLLGGWPADAQDFYRGRGNPRKHTTFHYITANITPRLNLGIFEGVIWSRGDNVLHRGFDLNYLNPVVFFRPIEFSVGSPDKVIMGANASYRLPGPYVLYGQFVLDEFKVEHIRARNGWHANKYGYQLGAKAYDAFGLSNLFLLAEYNRVRPFTYSHWQPLTQYSHYNQPLAHPLGANFWEALGKASYRTNRLHFSYHFSYALYGKDGPDENWGGNIFKNYNTFSKEFGNTIGQGLETRRTYHDANVSLLLMPKTNMALTLGYINRAENTLNNKLVQRWFYIGFRTSLDNYYYDF